MALATHRGPDHPARIDPDVWYSVRESAFLINDAVTEGTLKDYCRKGTVECKKVGPRHQWHILGQSLLDLLKAWSLDSR